MNKYTIDSIIGEGGKGNTVYKVICINSNNTYAMKCISLNISKKYLNKLLDLFKEYNNANKNNIGLIDTINKYSMYNNSNISNDEIELIKQLTEIEILKKLDHKNIIKYYDSFIDEKSNKLCIIMEYANKKDLHYLIKSNKSLKEKEIMFYFKQLIDAVEYLHKRKIIHRDIKPQNIFLTSKNEIKLGDFGIAKILNHTMDLAQSSTGTPYFLSPEICLGQKYSFKSDIWMMGCTLYELITLKKPFNSNNLINLMKVIVSKDIDFSIINKDLYSDNLINLCCALLNKNSNKRPIVGDIINIYEDNNFNYIDFNINNTYKKTNDYSIIDNNNINNNNISNLKKDIVNRRSISSVNNTNSNNIDTNYNHIKNKDNNNSSNIKNNKLSYRADTIESIISRYSTSKDKKSNNEIKSNSKNILNIAKPLIPLSKKNNLKINLNINSNSKNNKQLIKNSNNCVSNTYKSTKGIVIKYSKNDLFYNNLKNKNSIETCISVKKLNCNKNYNLKAFKEDSANSCSKITKLNCNISKNYKLSSDKTNKKFINFNNYIELLNKSNCKLINSNIKNLDNIRNKRCISMHGFDINPNSDNNNIINNFYCNLDNNKNTNINQTNTDNNKLLYNKCNINSSNGKQNFNNNNNINSSFNINSNISSASANSYNLNSCEKSKLLDIISPINQINRKINFNYNNNIGDNNQKVCKISNSSYQQINNNNISVNRYNNTVDTSNKKDIKVIPNLPKIPKSTRKIINNLDKREILNYKYNSNNNIISSSNKLIYNESFFNESSVKLNSNNENKNNINKTKNVINNNNIIIIITKL